jgi:hypothetical protein
MTVFSNSLTYLFKENIVVFKLRRWNLKRDCIDGTKENPNNRLCLIWDPPCHIKKNWYIVFDWLILSPYLNFCRQLNFSALGLLIFCCWKNQYWSRFVGTPSDAAILASMSHIYAELDMAHVAVWKGRAHRHVLLLIGRGAGARVSGCSNDGPCLVSWVATEWVRSRKNHFRMEFWIYKAWSGLYYSFHI